MIFIQSFPSVHISNKEEEIIKPNLPTYDVWFLYLRLMRATEKHHCTYWIDMQSFFESR